MRRPLIHLLIALIAGIITGTLLNFSYYSLLAVFALILFFLFVIIRNHGFEAPKQALKTECVVFRPACVGFSFRNWCFLNKWSIAGIFLIISFIFTLGVFDIQKQNYFIENECNIVQYVDKGKVTVEGVVIESPLTYLDKKVLIVRCLRVIKDKSYIPVSGKIRLSVPADINFQYGDFIRFHSTLKRIHNFNNPGSFDYERYLKRQSIYATGFIADTSGIILMRQNSASSIKLKLELFRVYLKQIIYKNAPSPQREIIEAMTIGNQKAIPADVRDNFNKTGTAHILSINGLHIGIIAASAFFFVFLILKSSEYMMLRFNIIKVSRRQPRSLWY